MIERNKHFTYAAVGNNEYTIVPIDYDNFIWNTKEGGSYAVAPARVLGLSYPDYLRFLLQMFPNDVVVRGKKGYPIAYWKKDKTLYTFIRLLDSKLSLAIGILEGEQNNVNTTDNERIN